MYIYIYIYIYMYVCVCVSVCVRITLYYITLYGRGCVTWFHAFCKRLTEWRFFKKWSIWLIFIWDVGVICVYICLNLCAIGFYYFCVCAVAHAFIYPYVMGCIFTYLHIFLLSVDGKSCYEGRPSEKGRLCDGVGNGLLQFDFLFRSNFMVAKGLFWFE